MSLMISIGDAAKQAKVSPHTLRYYEKIGLLAEIPKTDAGRRVYSENHLKQIRFIRRAQQLHFSLDEIKQLIHLDSKQDVPKPEARHMVQQKLIQIDESLNQLKLLKEDLQRLLMECHNSDKNSDKNADKNSKQQDECPILEGIRPSD
jgi:DNA-binding transcriptional MerR regulator